MAVDTLTREAELIAAVAAGMVGTVNRGTAGIQPSRNQGPAVPGVYACIVNVSAEIAKDGISKTRTNQQQGYKFRGIDEVQNALAPLLAKHGLVILPRMIERGMTERQSKSGGSLFCVVVEVEFDFVCAADGSTHTVRMFGEAMDSADKATPKAASAAYKNAAFQVFCIPTEGADDADETTHEVAAPAVAPLAPVGTRGGIPSAGNGGDSQHSRTPAPQAPAAPAGREERETRPPATGETRGPSDRPAPPYGFVYIDDYRLADNGFHDIRVGQTRYSTKTAVGRIAGEAFAAGRPVKLDSKPKEGTKGEHWLNAVIVWTGEKASGSDADL
jgi:hypothetical protein